MTYPSAKSKRLLAEGKIDAFLGFPPNAEELRAKQIGHVVVDSGPDRPWSQYFCCLVGANRDFVQKHLQATKRAVRALVKAPNLCALEPERAAQPIAEPGYNYAYALQTLQDVGYGESRECHARGHDPLLRPPPTRSRDNQVDPAADYGPGADWRFLTELKKELKVIRRCWQSRGRTSGCSRRLPASATLPLPEAAEP